MLEILSRFCEQLFGRHTFQATSDHEYHNYREEALRAALLKCGTLTGAEVDEYISYQFENLGVVDIPFDLKAANSEVVGERLIYLDDLLIERYGKIRRNQIAEETLKKVSRVLPRLCSLSREPDRCKPSGTCHNCNYLHRY